MKIHCLYDKLVPVLELKAHPDNHNDHPQDQIKRIAEILDYQGWRYPIKVSNQSGFITSGHGRWQAAVVNGWESVPVNFQDYEDSEQEYADVVADNAVALWASLNFSAINAKIPSLGPDFNLDLLGIKNFRLDVSEREGEDDVPEAPQVPKSRLGDLFQLGAHRLLCGDSTDITDVERLMGQEKADCVFTDPPYNVDYEGSDGQKIQNDNQTEEAFTTFCQAFFGNYFLSMKEGAAIYVFHADTAGDIFRATFKKQFKLSSCIIWNKSSLIMGRSDYHWKHEPCLYGWKPGAAHSWHADRTQTSVYDHAKGSGVDNKLHPTCKPISLVEYFLGNSSKLGDVVLDLFGGSGSTLIACEKMKRTTRMMELDPKFVDVIITRWQRMTGLDAIRDDGKKFNDLPRSANGTA